MLWRRIIGHLLPSGRALRAFPGSMLDKLLEGLAGQPEQVVDEADRVLFDIDPDATRELSRWEEQFGLRPRALTEQDRRDRVRGQWAAQGGQDPAYIERVLRSSGYPVRVHEWWIKRSRVTGVLSIGGGAWVASGGDALAWREVDAYPTPRNPAIITASRVQCGQPGAQCRGDLSVQCTEARGGYFLRNRTIDTRDTPGIPEDEGQWRYILYIGGEEFGDVVQIDAARRFDLETLALRICPAQQWLGMMIEYTE